MPGILLCVQMTRAFLGNHSTSSRDPSSWSLPTSPLPRWTAAPAKQTYWRPGGCTMSPELTPLCPYHQLNVARSTPAFLLQMLTWTFHLLHIHSLSLSLCRTYFLIRNVSFVSLAWVYLCSITYSLITTWSITEQKTPTLHLNKF